jgi:hypothetical protein
MAKKRLKVTYQENSCNTKKHRNGIPPSISYNKNRKQWDVVVRVGNFDSFEEAVSLLNKTNEVLNEKHV